MFQLHIILQYIFENCKEKSATVGGGFLNLQSAASKNDLPVFSVDRLRPKLSSPFFLLLTWKEMCEKHLNI